jgi:16S rRNA processing protein RimM
MGRVMAPFGVKGALKVEPFGDDRDSLRRHSAWWVGKPGNLVQVEVLECRAHDAHLVARFEGCSDRDQAGKYRGFEVALRREELPQTAEHEFYQADLVGLVVVNAKGEQLGRVTGFLPTGANEVMRVAHEGKERLLPVAGEVIRKVDLEAGTIEVDWEVDW